MSVTELPVITVHELDLPDDAATDGKAECPECGGRFTRKKDGGIRSHKCADGITSVDPVKSTGRTPRTKKGAPPKVRQLGVATIAAGVEWVSATSVARYVPCEPGQVPAELPDADMMIGPVIDALWPQVPPGAQKAIIKIADNSDLIACLFAWVEYGRTLKSWANVQHATIEKAKESQNGQQVPAADANHIGTNVFEFRPVQPDPIVS